MNHLIPVLDIMHGIVVRGVKGQRESYLPNESCLVDSCAPLDVANALIDSFQPEWLYVADLDGLQHRPVQWEVIASLCTTTAKLCVDAGGKKRIEIEQLLDIGVQKVVVALESLSDFDVLRELVDTFSSDRLVFSLDLKHGQPLPQRWQHLHAIDIAKLVMECGLNHLIVLDLAAVGAYDGVPTLSLCEDIKRVENGICLWTGGGVRSLPDLATCRQAGVNGVLVASALHDNKITPKEFGRC